MAAVRMMLSLAAGVVATGLLAGAAKGGGIKIAASLTGPATTQATTQSATQPAEKNHIVAKGSLNLEVSADVTLQAVDPFEVKIKPKAYTGSWTVVKSAAPGASVNKG